MLTMLTDLLGTIFATGPLSLCLQTPGPFSLWHCQSVPNEVTVISLLTIYIISLFNPKKLLVEEILLPYVSDLLLNVCPLSQLQLISEEDVRMRPRRSSSSCQTKCNKEFQRTSEMCNSTSLRSSSWSIISTW